MLKIIAFLVFQVLILINQTTTASGDCDCKGLGVIGSGKNCTISNRKWNEFLYPVDGANYDDKRRQVFTWIPGGCDNQCNWQIETIHTDFGHKFKLKSLYFNEYFHASANDLKYDKNRRNVFTWIPKTECEKQCYWEIQLLKDGSKYFTIKNTEFNEYLYGGEGLNYNDDRRRVFTWGTSYDVASDQASHWAIHCL